MIPLAVEAHLLGLAGFATGMLIGYIVELRRRYPLVSLKPHDFVE